MDEISSYRRITALTLLIMLTMITAGCRQVSAPIHVWAPPKLQSAVGHKIAIAPIAGDVKIAGPLHTAMMALAPQDTGRALYCIDTRSLPSTRGDQTIRLVSSIEGETSDIAVHSLAKRNEVDFILTGEIVRRPSEDRKASLDSFRGNTPQPTSPATGPMEASNDTNPKGDTATIAATSPGYLTVSWKLVDVRAGTPVSGMPIVTHHDASLAPQAVASAAAEDAWKLITPFVQADSAKLATTRLSFGSERLRRGNQAAIEGDWQLAEERWNQVVSRYPSHHAALHNLAIAAVARQDYESARLLIGQTLKLRNKPMYRETAVWIEARQRDYHQAFDLPDPEGGWAATRR